MDKAKKILLLSSRPETCRRCR